MDALRYGQEGLLSRDDLYNVPYDKHVLNLITMLGVKKFVTYKYANGYDDGDLHSVGDEMLTKLPVGWRIGASSLVSESLHVFMADCDDVKIKSFAQLDPIYEIVLSSEGSFQIYGPQVSWDAMREVWERFKVLGIIDDGWITNQIRRGFATLRVGGKWGTDSPPQYVGTSKTLSEIPQSFLELLSRT